MFGFGEKAKLKKMRDDVRGISLREVIEITLTKTLQHLHCWNMMMH
jgi:hypothetical protein